MMSSIEETRIRMDAVLESRKVPSYNPWNKSFVTGLLPRRISNLLLAINCIITIALASYIVMIIIPLIPQNADTFEISVVIGVFAMTTLAPVLTFKIFSKFSKSLSLSTSRRRGEYLYRVWIEETLQPWVRKEFPNMDDVDVNEVIQYVDKLERERIDIAECDSI